MKFYLPETTYDAAIKHITGFSKLFADKEYNRAWKTRTQLEAERKHGDGTLP